jgi:hypothetical protein
MELKRAEVNVQADASVSDPNSQLTLKNFRLLTHSLAGV